MSNRLKLLIFIICLALVLYAFLAFDIPYKNTDYVGRDVSAVISTTDKIFMESPVAGEIISSPLKISGQARGYWFFEASFPIEIVGADGTVLGQAVARAKASDVSWMTNGFVPWSATVIFDRGLNMTGEIRLWKNNPSHDPANDEKLDVPVIFATGFSGIIGI